MAETIRAEFRNLQNFAKKIAEPGDNQALTSRGNTTVKSQFDQTVSDLYDAVDELLRTFQGPDAEMLKKVIYDFKPSFASMSLTMASHADYLRHYVSVHKNAQLSNMDNTSVMSISGGNSFNNRG